MEGKLGEPGVTGLFRGISKSISNTLCTVKLCLCNKFREEAVSDREMPTSFPPSPVSAKKK